MSGSFSYDADDRMTSTEQYDNNGNTLVSGARTFKYDFQNRLKSMTNSANGVAATIVYDGDGNRVAKTVDSTTTKYLVDDLNPTGYAQVVEESDRRRVTRTYTYGLQRISQNQLLGSSQSSAVWTASFYEYDGIGSVRMLTVRPEQLRTPMITMDGETSFLPPERRRMSTSIAANSSTPTSSSII